MTVLSFLVLTLALAAFGMSDDGHHARRLGTRRMPRGRWKRLGWLLAAFSLPLPSVAYGWVFGPVVWLGQLMLAAALVFLTLNFAPVRQRR